RARVIHETPSRDPQATAKCPTEPERTSPQRRRSVRPSRSGLLPSDGEVSDRAGADFAPATAKCPTEPERTSPQRRRSVRPSRSGLLPSDGEVSAEPERTSPQRRRSVRPSRSGPRPWGCLEPPLSSVSEPTTRIVRGLHMVRGDHCQRGGGHCPGLLANVVRSNRTNGRAYGLDTKRESGLGSGLREFLARFC